MTPRCPSCEIDGTCKPVQSEFCELFSLILHCFLTAVGTALPATPPAPFIQCGGGNGTHMLSTAEPSTSPVPPPEICWPINGLHSLGIL